MKAYELLFFVAPSTDEESRTNAMNRIQTTITNGQGTIDNVDEWGKRKLAYEINGLTDGVYTLVDSMPIPLRLQNSIAYCASLMSLFAT